MYLADRIYMPTFRISGQTLPSYAHIMNSQSIWLLPPGQSSNSHVNRTDSPHSNNVRSASHMIPCFPVNNSTDVHHCDIVSSRSSPSHFTKDTPFNTSQVRTRSTTKKLNHCLENQKGYYLRNRNTGKCSCCNSSQDG